MHRVLSPPQPSSHLTEILGAGRLKLPAQLMEERSRPRYLHIISWSLSLLSLKEPDSFASLCNGKDFILLSCYFSLPQRIALESDPWSERLHMCSLSAEEDWDKPFQTQGNDAANITFIFWVHYFNQREQFSIIEREKSLKILYKWHHSVSNCRTNFFTCCWFACVVPRGNNST